MTEPYEKHDWQEGEVISEANLDSMEQGIEAATQGVIDLEKEKITSVKVTTLDAGQQATA